MIYKNSCMARKDGRTKEKTYYFDDEKIFFVDIKGVLLSLQCDSEFYNNPTKQGLKKALKEQKKLYMETISDDWDFYAEEVIPKFIKGIKR